ncbi:hypothetical protein [Paenibacillus bovis]|uniref:Uncharacterized protein n=1 Tax=Paenibacillus bovis TaxID=1616788 RepID=A0A1X9T4A5_9BACL|nr:hypothetical protein [Paenibacillus bovis]ARR10751.1 hypothetical protein AR543_p0143 [Paenibacillus bovis]
MSNHVAGPYYYAGPDRIGETQLIGSAPFYSVHPDGQTGREK